VSSHAPRRYASIPPGGIETTEETLIYSVPGVSCEHCRAAISTAVGAVRGVDSVDVDLDGKRVTVRGSGLDDAAVRAAIDEAGYDVQGAGP
jgi:copper chaperone CopZ